MSVQLSVVSHRFNVSSAQLKVSRRSEERRSLNKRLTVQPGTVKGTSLCVRVRVCVIKKKFK